MKDVLKQKDVFFDVHCHVFNYRDVPDRFLGIRIPQNPFILSSIEGILHRIIRVSDKDRFSNYGYFVDFLKSRSSEQIAEKLFNYYTEKNLIICPLMMDMTQGIEGKILDDFRQQIEKMKDLRDRFPAQVLPFIAMDPNNPQMEENFRKVFSDKESYKFFGVKIYPSLGYLPSHPELMKVYEICEEKRIPVTAHCSGAIVHSSKKRIVNIRGFHLMPDGSFSEQVTTRSFKKKADYAQFFNRPENWIPVLERFPKLKLNLAHFGGVDEWKKLSRGNSDNWVNRIIDLMHRYEFLYSDFSYTFYSRRYSKILKKMLTENSLIGSRVLYGSDYYMVVTEGHFRALKTGFSSIMGDVLMKKIAKENPLAFLFA
ncbi:MAG: amidohydrolase family protein [Bacteroidales bacterium]|nr:amidohydrolase family protein [Bacteroidales bacterium]